MAPGLIAQALLLAVVGAVAAQDPVDIHDGCIHMQVIHSTNTNYFSKRAVEFDLANRSDVAYYAKRMRLLLGPGT